MTTYSCDMVPACNRPVNQLLSFTLSHNQSVEQTHMVRVLFPLKSLFKGRLLQQYLTKVHKSSDYRGLESVLFEQCLSQQGRLEVFKVSNILA